MEQELPTLPEHMNSPSIFNGVCVIQSLVLCVCFVDHCLSFCPFSFGHCVVNASKLLLKTLDSWEQISPTQIYLCTGITHSHLKFNC